MWLASMTAGGRSVRAPAHASSTRMSMQNTVVTLNAVKETMLDMVPFALLRVTNIQLPLTSRTNAGWFRMGAKCGSILSHAREMCD